MHIYIKMDDVNKSSNLFQPKSVSLKEVRKKLNLTQSEFAELIGSDRTEVSRIENGKLPEWMSRAITLHRILSKTGYSYDDLLLSLPDPEN